MLPRWRSTPSKWRWARRWPTAIGLVSLTAQRVGAAVQVSWQTAFEQNTFGYYIYRSATDNVADAANVTNQIIPGQGTSGGS